MTDAALVNLGKPDCLPSDPLGIEALAGYIASELPGVNLKLIDQITFSAERGHIDQILPREQFDLIGISSMWPNFEHVAAVAAAIRKSHPKATIVVGGSIVEALGRTLLDDLPEIDMAVRGPGEGAITAIISGDPPHAIANTYYRSDSGTVFTRSVQEWPSNGSIPDRSLLMADQRASDYRYVSANIETSRGCDFGACTFCHLTADAFFHRAHGSTRYDRYRKAPLAAALEDYKVVVDLGMPRVNFVDEEFFGGRGEPLASQGASFLRAIIRDRIGLEVPKGIFARAPDISIESTELMKAAGITSVFVGVEAGDAEDLHLFAKGARVADSVTAIRLLRDAGIRLKAGFIMLHPLSTPSGVLRNIEFLEQNNLYGHVKNPLNVLDVIPDSSYYRAVKGIAPQVLAPRDPRRPNYDWVPVDEVLRKYWPIILQVNDRYSSWIDNMRVSPEYQATGTQRTISAESREFLGDMHRKAAEWLKLIALEGLDGLPRGRQVGAAADRLLMEIAEC